MATTRAVLRDTATMVRRIGQRVRTARPQIAADSAARPDRLQAMRPLVAAGRHQTRARVLGGDTHVPDKVLSVFEPHTETIRKGKIATPNEFGKLVTIQEAEHQIITAYEVHARRPADVTLWTPALDRHQAIFGRRTGSGRGRSRASARRRTNRRRSTAASDGWSCRGAARSRRRAARMNVNAGSAAANGGASGAKVASVCSNVDMDSVAVATMASTACIAGSAWGHRRTIW